MGEKGMSNSVFSRPLWAFISSHVDDIMFTPEDRQRIHDNVIKVIDDVYEERVRCSPPH